MKDEERERKERMQELTRKILKYRYMAAVGALGFMIWGLLLGMLPMILAALTYAIVYGAMEIAEAIYQLRDEA